MVKFNFAALFQFAQYVPYLSEKRERSGIRSGSRSIPLTYGSWSRRLKTCGSGSVSGSGSWAFCFFFMKLLPTCMPPFYFEDLKFCLYSVLWNRSRDRNRRHCNFCRIGIVNVTQSISGFESRSGTGFGPGSYKVWHKSKNITNSRLTFWETMLLLSLKGNRR